MNNIRNVASERIKAEVKYEKVSFWCWQVFLGLSIMVFGLLIISICDFGVDMVVLMLGL